MTPWLPRALAVAVLHLGVGVGVEVAASRAPEQGGLLRWGALALLVVVALAWGTWDGTRAARAEDDPTVRWVWAAVVAAPVAALGVWLVRAVALDATGAESLVPQLLGGGAFTALLVLLPALTGLALGRWLVAPSRRRREELEEDDAPDGGAPDELPDAGDVAEGGLGGRLRSSRDAGRSSSRDAGQSSTAPEPGDGSRAMAE